MVEVSKALKYFNLCTLFRGWTVAMTNRKYRKLGFRTLKANNLITPSYLFDIDGNEVIISLQGETTLFIVTSTQQRFVHTTNKQLELFS